MSYYSFYDEEGKLIKEIFAYSRDTAFHLMRDTKWKSYKRTKFSQLKEKKDE